MTTRNGCHLSTNKKETTMSAFAAALETRLVPEASNNQSLTANGMATLNSSLDPLVDFFFFVGASRGKPIRTALERAWQADPQNAARILFWARDIRGGSGERELFRQGLLWLEQTHPDQLEKLIPFVPTYGRWDDLLIFQTTRFQNMSYSMFALALSQSDGLAGKWSPRKGPVANALRKYMNLTPKSYRQLIVGASNTVEQKMSAKEWESINYSHVPSVAAARYQKAFTKRDGERYAAYRASLVAGTAKVNAGAVYPYDIIKSLKQGGDRVVANAQWEALPNYLGDDFILPLVDVSGSMTCSVGDNPNLTCMDVAVSLGLYLATKQQGPFAGLYLTFTTDSKIAKLPAGDLLTKYASMSNAEWAGSTNIESAFRAILQLAVNHKIPADQMPKSLIIFSDQEYNSACRDGKSIGVFDLARNMFEQANYSLPNIIFWNLNARSTGQGNVPVTYDQNGTALVSGFSPSLLKSILASKTFTPADVMWETIGSERYQQIQINK